jgi:hypothetical protein
VILVISTTVDKFLLAEAASLASAGTLVGAILDHRGLLAAVRLGSLGESVVAKQNRALGVVACRVLQAEGKASVIAPFVVFPFLGGKFDIFGEDRNLDDGGGYFHRNRNNNGRRGRGVLCQSNGQDESSNDEFHF